MQISIQKLLNDEASKREITTAMLKNFEDHFNIFSDEDEPLKILNDFDFTENFLITDIRHDYDLWAYKEIILKINDSYFSWSCEMNARYGDWEFYKCQKVVPVKKTILDVDFIPVFPDYKIEKETEAYKKIFHTGL